MKNLTIFILFLSVMFSLFISGCNMILLSTPLYSEDTGCVFDSDCEERLCYDGTTLSADCNALGECVYDGSCDDYDCESGSYRCDGDSLQKCEKCDDDTGKWDTVEECEYGCGCDGDECFCNGYKCNPGSYQCDGDSLQKCDDDTGEWYEVEECNYGCDCDGDECFCNGYKCNPGSYQCVEGICCDSLQKCNDNGEWDNYKKCDEGCNCICDENECSCQTPSEPIYIVTAVRSGYARTEGGIGIYDSSTKYAKIIYTVTEKGYPVEGAKLTPHRVFTDITGATSTKQDETFKLTTGSDGKLTATCEFDKGTFPSKTSGSCTESALGKTKVTTSFGHSGDPTPAIDFRGTYTDEYAVAEYNGVKSQPSTSITYTVEGDTAVVLKPYKVTLQRDDASFKPGQISGVYDPSTKYAKIIYTVTDSNKKPVPNAKVTSHVTFKNIRGVTSSQEKTYSLTTGSDGKLTYKCDFESGFPSSTAVVCTESASGKESVITSSGHSDDLVSPVDKRTPIDFRGAYTNEYATAELNGVTTKQSDKLSYDIVDYKITALRSGYTYIVAEENIYGYGPGTKSAKIIYTVTDSNKKPVPNAVVTSYGTFTDTTVAFNEALTQTEQPPLKHPVKTDSNGKITYKCDFTGFPTETKGTCYYCKTEGPCDMSNKIGDTVSMGGPKDLRGVYTEQATAVVNGVETEKSNTIDYTIIGLTHPDTYTITALRTGYTNTGEPIYGPSANGKSATAVYTVVDGNKFPVEGIRLGYSRSFTDINGVKYEQNKPFNLDTGSDGKLTVTCKFTSGFPSEASGSCTESVNGVVGYTSPQFKAVDFRGTYTDECAYIYGFFASTKSNEISYTIADYITAERSGYTNTGEHIYGPGTTSATVVYTVRDDNGKPYPGALLTSHRVFTDTNKHSSIQEGPFHLRTGSDGKLTVTCKFTSGFPSEASGSCTESVNGVVGYTSPQFSAVDFRGKYSNEYVSTNVFGKPVTSNSITYWIDEMV